MEGAGSTWVVEGWAFAWACSVTRGARGAHILTAVVVDFIRRAAWPVSVAPVAEGSPGGWGDGGGGGGGGGRR